MTLLSKYHSDLILLNSKYNTIRSHIRGGLLEAKSIHKILHGIVCKE